MPGNSGPTITKFQKMILRNLFKSTNSREGFAQGIHQPFIQLLQHRLYEKRFCQIFLNHPIQPAEKEQIQECQLNSFNQILQHTYSQTQTLLENIFSEWANLSMQLSIARHTFLKLSFSREFRL